jgi:hypothetical protein
MLRLLRRHRWTPAVDDQVKSGGGEPQVRAFALAGRSAIEAAIGALVQLVRGGDGVDGREKIEDRPLQRYTVGSARRPTPGPPREVAAPGSFRSVPGPAAPRCPGDPVPTIVQTWHRLPVASGTCSANSRVQSAGLVPSTRRTTAAVAAGWAAASWSRRAHGASIVSVASWRSPRAAAPRRRQRRQCRAEPASGGEQMPAGTGEKDHVAVRTEIRRAGG